MLQESSNEVQTVSARDATPPHGHYSQAIRHEGLVYVSGLLGNSLLEHVDANRDMASQAAHCMEQLDAILRSAGSSLQRVIKFSVYVTDIAEWPAVDGTLARDFGEHRPARIVVPVGTVLRFGSAIEIDAIAAAG